MPLLRTLDVLIASPSDAMRGREAVERTLEEWNRSRSDREGLILKTHRWETGSVPLMGTDAQSVINMQLVDRADIVFAMFYRRLGSATPRAVAGTAEEIQRSVDAGKVVHVYFCEADVPYNSDWDQFNALRRFRTEMESKGFVHPFRSEEELSAKVRQAIEFDVSQILSRSGRDDLSAPPFEGWAQISDSDARSVLAALGSTDQYRTARGLSKQTGQSQSAVQLTLDRFPQFVRRSTIRSAQGTPLYRLRDRQGQ